MMHETYLVMNIEEIAGEYLAVVYPCPHTRTALRVPAVQTPAGLQATVFDHQVVALIRQHFAECDHCGMGGQIEGDLKHGTLRHHPREQTP